MSINSIQGYQSIQNMQSMMGMRQEKALTDDQKTQIQSILSQYDPENISEADAQSIFEQFSDAGIQPGKGMKEAIEAAGFDAEQLRSLGMPAMQPPPDMGGMQESSELTEEQAATVQSILSNYDPENITASDAKSIFAQFNDAGIYPMKGLKEAIESSGFDAESLRAQGMSQDNTQENLFWAIQNTSQGIDTTALQNLQSILDQYDFSTSLTSDQQDTLITQLQNYSLLQSGSNLNLSI